MSQKLQILVGSMLALASGVLLALAFPPFKSPEAAWFAVVPIIVCARLTTPRVAFRYGSLAGFVFWLITSAWLLAMHRAGGPLPLVLLAWIGLSAYCALYLGVFTALAAMLWHGWRWSPAVCVVRRGHDPDSFLANLPRLFALPLIWVGCEYLRSELFSGFAWNTLGVSQWSNLAAIQGAEFGGVYVVSALCMVMNATIALTGISVLSRLLDRRRNRRMHPELLIGLTIWGVAMSMGFVLVRSRTGSDASASGNPVRIALIQSNIAQDDKWQTVSSTEILKTLQDLTLKAKLSAPDLIVWPETALPQPADSEPIMRNFVMTLAGEESEILVGTIEARRRAQEDAYDFYNSAMLFSGEGPRWPYYRKVHLVPFGEYIPGEQFFPALQQLSPIGYSCRAGLTNTVFRLNEPAVAFSALICFEDTIAGLARRSVVNGAQFLVNLTNDAWFEDSWAGWQHMAHCVFRCVENRVPAVRCANLGVSCYISSVGKVDDTTRASLAREGKQNLDYRVDEIRVPAAPVRRTFYNRYGDLPFALPCGTFCALALLGAIGRERLSRRRSRVDISEPHLSETRPTEHDHDNDG